MLRVVRWFISSLYGSYAGRTKSAGFERKPYNPILGEQFHCHWKSATSKNTNTAKSDSNSATANDYGDTIMICEQVSHHPPVTAFAIRNEQAKVWVSGHCGQRTKFTGTAIKVEQEGRIFLQLDRTGGAACANSNGNLNNNFGDTDSGPYEGGSFEEYAISLPELYLRGLLMGAPFVELCGDCLIVGTTGLAASIKFLPKPWIGGEYDLLEGQIYEPSTERCLVEIWGKWSKQTWYQEIASDPLKEHLVHIQQGIIDRPDSSDQASTSIGQGGGTFPNDDEYEDNDDNGNNGNNGNNGSNVEGTVATSGGSLLFDSEAMKPTGPIVKPVVQQSALESRKVWNKVTEALCIGDYELATEAKNLIEEEQRALRKERAEHDTEWQPNYFTFVPNFFLFNSENFATTSSTTTTTTTTTSNDEYQSVGANTSKTSINSFSQVKLPEFPPPLPPADGNAEQDSPASQSSSDFNDKQSQMKQMNENYFVADDYPGRWVAKQLLASLNNKSK